MRRFGFSKNWTLAGHGALSAVLSSACFGVAPLVAWSVSAGVTYAQGPQVAAVQLADDDDDPFGTDVKPEDAAKAKEAAAKAAEEAAAKAKAVEAAKQKEDAARKDADKKDEKKDAEKKETEKKDGDKKEEPKKADSPKDEPKKEGDKKEGEKEGEKKPDEDTIEITPMKQVVDPDTVKVYLGDGSIVTGKLTMQDISMETEFGQLKIPVTKILSFTPGLDSTPSLGKQIAESVQALGSTDFKVRDAAQKQLLSMGVAVRTELARHTSDSNAERVKRIREVITKLDELAEEASEENQSGRNGWSRGDTIVTDEFTVVGKIIPQEFTFESKYGTLGVALADIRTMRREVGGGASEIRKSLAVEGQYLATMSFKDAKLRVEAGDKVTITAGGKVTMTPWGNRSQVGPDGNTRFGNLSMDGQNFPGGALVGKVGSGKMFKVGASHTFTADKAGTLQFAIAVHSSYGRGEYQFPGQYDLKIKVTRAGQ